MKLQYEEFLRIYEIQHARPLVWKCHLAAKSSHERAEKIKIDFGADIDKEG